MSDFEQRDAYANQPRAVPPDTFTGPGQNTTPFGYVPQYGVTDPIVAGELAKEYGFNQAQNAGLIQGADQFTLNQNARDLLYSQLGYQNASFDLSKQELQNQNQNALANLGLDQERLGVQQGALNRQNPLLTSLHQLSGKDFDLQRLGAWQQADIANRSSLSDAITRGANTSIGFNQRLGDIRNQLANQLAGIDIGSQRETLGYNEDISKVGDQQKMLDIAGRELGLKGNQLADQLNIGLQRLGLQNSLSVNDLLQKINSSNIQDRMFAQQIWNSAIQNSDYYAQFYPIRAEGPSTIDPSTGVSNQVNPLTGVAPSDANKAYVQQGAS